MHTPAICLPSQTGERNKKALPLPAPAYAPTALRWIWKAQVVQSSPVDQDWSLLIQYGTCDVWVTAAAAVGLLSLSLCSHPAPVAGTSVHEAWRFMAHSSCWHSDLLFLSSVHTYVSRHTEHSQQSDFLRPEDRLWCSSTELSQTSCWPDTFTLNQPLLPLFPLFFLHLFLFNPPWLLPFPIFGPSTKHALIFFTRCHNPLQKFHHNFYTVPKLSSSYIQ